MYTQLHIGTRIKPDITEEEKQILMFMTGQVDEQPKITSLHSLFKTDRWFWMLRSDSYYFDYKTHCRFDFDDIGNHYWFNVTTNLKNYNSEIEKFLDWLYLLIDKSVGEEEFLGYYRYEENNMPTLIFKGSMLNSL